MYIACTFLKTLWENTSLPGICFRYCLLPSVSDNVKEHMSGCCGEDRWDEVSSGQAEAGDARDARLSWGRALASWQSVTPAPALMMGWHRSPGGSWHLIQWGNVRCSSGGKYSENWWVHLAEAVFWALAVLSAQGCECWALREAGAQPGQDWASYGSL